uniref:Uncharacterized protein n=1 Tax=Caenorhabditis tropicalis TaxID=1561998 RepID=A0A1I7TLF0_9PELO
MQKPEDDFEAAAEAAYLEKKRTDVTGMCPCQARRARHTFRDDIMQYEIHEAEMAKKNKEIRHLNRRIQEYRRDHESALEKIRCMENTNSAQKLCLDSFKNLIEIYEKRLGLPRFDDQEQKYCKKNKETDLREESDGDEVYSQMEEETDNEDSFASENGDSDDWIDLKTK